MTIHCVSKSQNRHRRDTTDIFALSHMLRLSVVLHAKQLLLDTPVDTESVEGFRRDTLV